jgi:hypothetical protein
MFYFNFFNRGTTMTTKDQPKGEPKANSHAKPVESEIINNLMSNDQALRNEVLKLKSSQNLLVNKVHNLEALVSDMTNEVIRLRSETVLNKTSQ